MPVRRIRLVMLGLVMGFGVVLLRLFYWQILVSESLSTAATGQHFSSFEIPAARGKILASDGYALAANRESFLLFANLSEFELDPAKAAKEIAEIVYPRVSPRFVVTAGQADEKERHTEEIVENSAGLIKEIKSFTKEEYEKWLEDRLRLDLPWVALVRNVDRETMGKIEKLNFKGIGFEKTSQRFYPEGLLAAHVLGFVGVDELGAERGYFGLEGFYNRELAGLAGEKRLEKDALGRPIIKGQEDSFEPQNGRSIVLTLDRAVQFAAEKLLAEGVEEWGAKGGTVVVMRPSDGAILAMASVPVYDPGLFFQYDKDLYKNPAAADLFEPGSILKPLVMAAGINEGLVGPETRCDRCGGPRRIGDYTIRTFNDVYHPNLSMIDVLVNSDNTGMVFVSEKLGLDRLYAYLLKLGLGSRTGVDLEDEESVGLRQKGQWSAIDLATASFGQGLVVTAVQMAQLTATLANGGYLVEPYLVEKVLDGDREIFVERPRPKRVFSQDTTERIKEMLVEVAEKSPLKYPKNRVSGLENYKIAAKSGTAQIPLRGKYSENRTIASVIGFAPADHPKFLVYVKLVEPKKRPWGSDTAGPIFFKIVKDLFLYYNIAPE